MLADQPPLDPVGATVTVFPTLIKVPALLTTETDPSEVTTVVTVEDEETTVPKVTFKSAGRAMPSACCPEVARVAEQGVTTSRLPTASGCPMGNVLLTT